jgi:AraC-like DNA-binding protein
MAEAIQVFSTKGVPAARKVEMWNSILGELTDAVRAQPRDPLHFDGTLTRQRVGPLTVFEVRCASVRVSHETRRTGQRRRPSFQVLMPVQGEFSLVHGDRPSATVGTGSLCLIDRSAPYEMIHGDGLCTIGIELPLALLQSCLPEANRYAGAVVRPDSGASRVLGHLLRSLGFELSAGEEPGAFPPVMARSIAGFVAAAFLERSSRALRGDNAGRLSAFRDYVDACLGDGEFRPINLARHFNVSERCVRLVFQSAGESLSGFLLRRRLERAAELLRSEFHGHQTITGIALECGFNSASHFGQCFRRRYHITPREYRAGRGSLPG